MNRSACRRENSGDVKARARKVPSTDAGSYIYTIEQSLRNIQRGEGPKNKTISMIKALDLRDFTI